MKNLCVIIFLSLAGGVFSEESAKDLIRFTNGDQLHGNFSGMKSGPTVSWKRADLENDVEFKSSELRQIILNGGRPEQPLAGLDHIGTVNGDRLPGKISSLNDTELILETEYAGSLKIPRSQVGLIAPNPLGGRIVYQGPFAKDEWTMVNLQNAELLKEPENLENGDVTCPVWNFSGSAWYYQDNSVGTALVRKSGVPDKAVIQFDIAWKNRLALAVAFHADFTNPLPEEKQEEQLENFNHPGHPNHMPLLFGSSYVLQLNSHYAVLARSSFDESGNPVLDRVQTSNTAVRLGESGSARIELRCNRVTGEIILFVDGQFVVQWSELPNTGGAGEGGVALGEGYAGKGDGIGFFTQNNQTAVRVSEIVMAEWNGMPDAARSLQVDDFDIVLLSNGTDRISGNVKSIKASVLKISGRYGEFEIPMDEVAEIRFAKSRLAKASKDGTSDQVKVRFYPVGRISGQPVAGNSEMLRIRDENVGEVEISLKSAVMLEFETVGNFIDDWDDDF